MCLNSSCHSHPGVSPSLAEIPTLAQSHGGLWGSQRGNGWSDPQFTAFLIFFFFLTILISYEFWDLGLSLCAGHWPSSCPKAASPTTCLLNFYVASEGRAIWKLKLINACKTRGDPGIKGAIETQFILQLSRQPWKTTRLLLVWDILFLIKSEAVWFPWTGTCWRWCLSSKGGWGWKLGMATGSTGLCSLQGCEGKGFFLQKKMRAGPQLFL